MDYLALFDWESMPRRRNWLTGLLLLSACVSACTGAGSDAPGRAASPAAGGQPVITSAAILNAPLSRDSPVAVDIRAEDPERQALHFRYQWYVDERPVAGQTSPTLSPDQLRRGQLVSVEITPVAGQRNGQTVKTAAVPVGNTPPRVTAVSIVPSDAQRGQVLEAQAEASDPDHDRTDLRFAWYRNGKLWKEGEDRLLDTAQFAPGDQIVVEVQARDDAAAGKTMRSIAVTLGNREPKIISSPPSTANGLHYEYAVSAVDPDGDRVTYRLEAAPPGMSINSQSGVIAWDIPPDQRGAVHVRVVADDGHGIAVFQEFDLHISAPVSTASVSTAQ